MARTRAGRIAWWLVVATCGVGGAAEGERPAGEILRALDGVQIPRYDSSRKDDPSYEGAFLAQLRAATERRAALILELDRAAPEHERIPGLLAERWSVRPFGLAADQLREEVEGALARSGRPEVRVEATHARARARIADGEAGDPVTLAAIEAFLELAPADPRGVALLRLLARRTPDDGARVALEDRIVARFPDSPEARAIRGVRDRDGRVGRPFDLEFTDAIGGAAVSVAKLRGRVVVVDFWATWCGPCVESMPRMKGLHARYHDRGVEFVGVSLDRPEAEGGLRSLRNFVEAQGIAWPQYYQGRGWDGEFSASCGIRSIPAVFVVDAEGKLRSVDAGDGLEALIVELLKERPEIRPPGSAPGR